ncbi:MAG: glycosyltransferase [Paludibacteraceae bacterium]|nr:glycosyltransferase [Paludibacteraceae bacterium]
MHKKTKISVGVITYNQESTIRQTLDSILAQKGDFDLELVIGEDCSTDATHAICEEYALRFNELTNERVNELKRVEVKLLPNTHNLGIMSNFARVMQACTGDYVAICAGDDYWCDEYKLQKQLDYFKAHPEVGVVSTSGYKLLVKSNTLVPYAIAPFKPIADGNIKPFYFSPDYKGGVYAMPLSLLIRRDLLQYVDFDEFIRRGFPVEDYPMQAILAQHCKWGHIDDLCVVYRVYKESATFISFDHPKYLQYYRGLAEIRRYLNELFPDDACFTEAQIQVQLFYKEFLLYLHNLEYKKAKELIANTAAIANTPKVRQAKYFTKTRLHFFAAHFVKERAYKNDLKERT